MTKPTLTPLKASDLVDMYGFNFPYSVRGYAAHLDGETIAVTGIAYTLPPQCFIMLKEGVACRFPREVIKGMQLMRELFNDQIVPIYATPEDNEPTADSFLKHIGFKQIEEGVYQWPQQ